MSSSKMAGRILHHTKMATGHDVIQDEVSEDGDRIYVIKDGHRMWCHFKMATGCDVIGLNYLPGR